MNHGLDPQEAALGAGSTTRRRVAAGPVRVAGTVEDPAEMPLGPGDYAAFYRAVAAAAAGAARSRRAGGRARGPGGARGGPGERAPAARVVELRDRGTDRRRTGPTVRRRARIVALVAVIRDILAWRL